MKQLFTFLAVLFCLNNIAQIPHGYYNTATGTSYVLKTQLYNIIKNNTNSSSSSASYGGLWTLYTRNAFRDNYYENDNTLLDIYSEKPAATDSYNFSATSQQCGNYNSEGDCYNREHTVPQSIWNSNYPMYSDAHFVLPSDGYVNGKRSSYPYGKVNAATWTSTNGSKLGNNTNSGYSTGYTGTVFEPIDEFKGDIARCLLYFATRYEDQVKSWSYDMFDGTSTQVFTNTFLNILLTWNILDPVSSYEIAKNNEVYVFQGNRNPYIDHPEYVCRVWSSACALETNEFEFATLSVFPNPTNNGSISINTNSSIDAIQVISINGQLINDIKNPVKLNETYTIENLPQGFYFLKLSSNNNSITKKISVN